MLEADLRADLLTGLQDNLGAAALRVDATRAFVHAEEIIRERTQRGEFLDGSSPGAAQYSTNPFALPAAALPKDVRELLDDTKDGSSFFTRAGDLWMTVKGGYKWLREALGYQSDHVDLNRSGALLGGLTTRTGTGADGLTAEVGYPEGADADAARIADFHQNQGAGPRHVIRRFIGLTDDEADLIVEDFAAAVRRQITE